MVVTFDARLWLWEARRDDSWTFVSLPADASEDIRARAGGLRRGFGSLRVRATIGATTWTTSIFPGGAGGAYVLPVKQAVRRAQSIEAGDSTAVTVALRDL